MRRSAPFAATLVTALALAAGCGEGSGGGQSSASEWAESFCTAVTTWTAELGKIGDGVGDPSSLSADTLEQAARDANEASDELVDEVRSLGTPDVDSGDEVKASAEGFADSVEAERNKIEEAVGDSSGFSDIAAAVTAIGGSLSAMAGAFRTTLEEIENADVAGELESAFEESSACDGLAS